MTKKSTIIALATVMFTASTLGFSGIVMASDTNPASSWKSSQQNIKSYLKNAPGVIGQVTVINGSIITLAGKNNTSYTVDASSAKILKNRNTIITVADIKIGDTVTAQGTVIGTSITATTVFDGKPITSKASKSKFPGIIGVVGVINGNTLSVTTKDNTTYTVDATNAKISKGSKKGKISISGISVGDNIMVRGTINGTNIIAKSIMDNKLTTKI